MLHFQPSQPFDGRSDVRDAGDLSSVSLQFTRSLQGLGQLDFSPPESSDPLALASFSAQDKVPSTLVAQGDRVILLRRVNLVDDAFANVDSWGARAIARAEHGERVPPKGAVDWTQFDHRDPGDYSRWNRGYCSTLASSPAAGNQRCIDDNRADGAKAIQDFTAAGLSNPGPVAFINLVDLYNQRPIAAPHYATWLAKLLREGKPAAEAILEARVEAFRKDGTGDYITGGPTWHGLQGICETSPAYEYIEKDMGLAKGSQPWLRQCILHNQKQRWERINEALEAHSQLQYGSLANNPASGNRAAVQSPANSAPAQSGQVTSTPPANGAVSTTQPVEGARDLAPRFDLRDVPGGWISWLAFGLIACGAYGWWSTSRQNQGRGQSDDGAYYENPSHARRQRARRDSNDFANRMRNRRGPFR